MQTQKPKTQSRFQWFFSISILLSAILSYTRAAIIGDYIDIVVGAVALIYIARYLIRLAKKKKKRLALSRRDPT